MVGNYGVAADRGESARPHARAVVMREARGPAWTDWLHEHGLVALSGIDTRSLVLHLRKAGAMRAIAVSGDASVDEALAAVREQPAMAGRALAPGVSAARAVRLQRRGLGADRGGRLRLQALDPAAGSPGRARPSRSIRTTRARTSSPATTASCSRTGPATPSRSRAEVETVKALLGRVPVFGICLGHQLLALATGHETFKLPFGHRGANHPVLDKRTNRVLVTSQNHGFAVAPSDGAEATHVSLYDGTVEGLDFPELARALGPVPSRGAARPARRVAAARASGSRRCRLPRRRDLRSICLIGSGPIVIGQACEFDYAGCQALKVLREDGFRTIVVNSNPATIMTDPGFADRTYLEPLDLEGVADVLGRERPDALLPTMGGQTALNLGARAARGRRARRARDRADRRSAPT